MARFTNEELIKKFNQDLCQVHMGISAQFLDDKECRMILQLKDWHVNFEGCVHGGILFSAVDSAMGMVIYPHLKDDEHILAIDIKINYIKGATLEMEELSAHTNMVSRTRRLAVAEGEIFAPDGALLSKALGTFAILQVRDP